jgi:glycosyltransferase involved in cell wall biosynthesis
MRHRVPLVMIGTPAPGTPKPAAADAVVVTDVPHAEVMASWARCAVAVVPSIWPEPSATTVFEAMSCGRPIVCSDIGGLPEVVEHGVSGLIVPPGEPDALSRALDRLIGDPALRRRLGAEARARFGDFTASAVCERIERTYREVLAEATNRAGARA